MLEWRPMRKILNLEERKHRSQHIPDPGSHQIINWTLQQFVWRSTQLCISQLRNNLRSDNISDNLTTFMWKCFEHQSLRHVWRICYTFAHHLNSLTFADTNLTLCWNDSRIPARLAKIKDPPRKTRFDFSTWITSNHWKVAKLLGETAPARRGRSWRLRRFRSSPWKQWRKRT